jgi:hypothetical protein
MEAVSTSETEVNFYETSWWKIPEESRLYTRRRENLKYYFQVVSGSEELAASIFRVESLATTDETTLSDNALDHSPNSHRCEHIKSDKVMLKMWIAIDYTRKTI